MKDVYVQDSFGITVIRRGDRYFARYANGEDAGILVENGVTEKELASLLDSEEAAYGVLAEARKRTAPVSLRFPSDAPTCVVYVGAEEIWIDNCHALAPRLEHEGYVREENPAETALHRFKKAVAADYRDVAAELSRLQALSLPFCSFEDEEGPAEIFIRFRNAGYVKGPCLRLIGYGTDDWFYGPA